MLKKAERELGVDLANSIMIGDKQSDIQAGTSAGVRLSIMIHENKETLPLGIDHSAKDLFSAVKYLKSYLSHE